jgi:type IV pilus assembly protein PilO
MAALLSDINQAGVGRGLAFELFRPDQVVVRDYYAELPIAIKITGKYHDLGAFAGRHGPPAAHRHAQQHALKAEKDGVLTLDAIAKTFRYLDADELATQKAARLKAKKSKKAEGQP